MVLAEFTMSPFDKGDSISPYVARVLDVIDKSGLRYRLTPMSTILEGEWDAVFGAIKRCHEVIHEMGAPRISTTRSPAPSVHRSSTMHHN